MISPQKIKEEYDTLLNFFSKELIPPFPAAMGILFCAGGICRMSGVADEKALEEAFVFVRGVIFGARKEDHTKYENLFTDELKYHTGAFVKTILKVGEVLDDMGATPTEALSFVLTVFTRLVDDFPEKEFDEIMEEYDKVVKYVLEG